MSGSALATGVSEAREPGKVQPAKARNSAAPVPAAEPDRRERRRFAAIDGWRGVGWLACGFAVGLAIDWFIFVSRADIGSKAEWFAGAGAFAAVAVALWQTLNIQRNADQAAVEAAERLRREVAAAEARSARELAFARSLHHAELEAQRELARVQRIHLLEQQQKQAMIAVSRAVGAHTHMLATLWNQGATVLRIEDRDEREQAMNPIFEQIGQVVNDFSVELVNAHLLIEDERLHHALDRVNEAALMAIRVAEDVHVAVVDGHAPSPNPIPAVQSMMHQRAAEARRLAWDLLRTGLDNNASPTG